MSGRDDGSVFVLPGSPENLERAPENVSEPAAKVYAPGGAFDVYQDLVKIIAAAKQSLFLVDPYADEEVFDLYLPRLAPGVSIRLLTGYPSTPLKRVATKFAYRPGVRFEARATKAVHDRVIIVDSTDCWVLGQSIKDAAVTKPTYLLPVEAVKDMVDLYERAWLEAIPY